ncbi:peptidylprolyl isomerase [Candidatus Nitronereus thalassa]|uniref:Peptidyl-prolyl cis-trans isomerase n=1 Tax=Candidatus Nitronereus thalassa TaxID=3020898 RepID=A0ABU3K6L6_9BACT|nr:peptidylprolyl isomerase [Candidatus Nitronereus thalassa]MDT7042009.1 peptidylprolyl isomerase [Candidatus Nitronereus thalassa]
MALLIGEKSVVSMHYKLMDEAGKVLDSSEGGEPLAYLHGAGNIVSGLEKALVGKSAGDSLTVKVAPAEGYGEVDPNGIKVIERAAFEGVDVVEAGMAFEAKAPDGTAQHIVVTKVEGDEVTIDLNHPLAGVTLNFDIQIVNVREATQEELDHGHTHEGGHAH